MQGVEEQAGAAGIEVIGGQALDDHAEGVLDGGAVLGEWHVEGGAVGFSALGFLFWDCSAGGVVVVAKFFSAKCRALAAVAADFDVAALEAGFLIFFVVAGFENGCIHGVAPPPGVLLGFGGIQVLRLGSRRLKLALKTKARRVPGDRVTS